MQTDALLPKYLRIAETNSAHILHADRTLDTMKFMMNWNDEYTSKLDDDEDDNVSVENEEEDVDIGTNLANSFLYGNNDSNESDDECVDDSDR